MNDRLIRLLIFFILQKLQSHLVQPNGYMTFVHQDFWSTEGVKFCFCQEWLAHVSSPLSGIVFFLNWAIIWYSWFNCSALGSWLSQLTNDIGSSGCHPSRVNLSILQLVTFLQKSRLKLLPNYQDKKKWNMTNYTKIFTVTTWKWHTKLLLTFHWPV